MLSGAACDAWFSSWDMNKKQTQIDHGLLADKFAPVMFCLSLLFLVLLAALIVVWVDVPRFELTRQQLESIRSSAENGQLDDAAQQLEVEAEIVDQLVSPINEIGNYLSLGVVVLWVIIVFEVLIQLYLSVRSIEMRGERRWRMFAYCQCLCPPLRLAAPNIAKEGQIWLPWLGWQSPSRKLFKRLVAAFSKPMLFFSLLILPLLLIEFGLHSLMEEQAWLRVTIHICTGLIWCAFAIEFIVLVSASKRRLKYVKKNWIDLAIILLPLILFLRSLRALRLLRFAKFAKVQQLARVSRIYRMRGVAMKALRAFMLFEVGGRALGLSPQRRMKRLQSERKEKLEELEDIDEEIAKVQLKIDALQAKEEGDQEAKEEAKPGSATNPVSAVNSAEPASPTNSATPAKPVNSDLTANKPQQAEG